MKTYKMKYLEVAEKKAADDEKQRAEKEAKAAENMSTMQTANATMPQKKRREKRKAIDSMFSKEHHAEKLAREPILTYQEVERQFGIHIAGFGRGINPTENSVVLIPSIGKKMGNSFITIIGRWRGITFTPAKARAGTSP